MIILSPPGDTDIIVLVVSLLNDYKDHVIINNGSGKARKSICLGGIELSQHRCRSLIGLHSSTGNDYISSFFKKGKDQCWKLLEKHQKFEDCFANLRLTSSLPDEMFQLLEEFVCLLYGIRSKSVNEARRKIFERKNKREKKIPNLSSLPPCKDVLWYHALRSNFVAYIWRNSIEPIIDIPNIAENGWLSTGEILWLDDAFPEEIDELLCNNILDNYQDDEDEDEYEQEDDHEFYGMFDTTI